MLVALRVIGSCIVGLVVGSMVNMALVTAGPLLIPPPAGADMTTVEGLAAAMPLLEPKHFLFPFLAHALGTFAGAWLAGLLAGEWRRVAGYAIGGLFFVGGIAASRMIPAPTWFVALDLVGAYLPMAWLGVRLAQRNPKMNGKPTTTKAAHPA